MKYIRCFFIFNYTLPRHYAKSLLNAPSPHTVPTLLVYKCPWPHNLHTLMPDGATPTTAHIIYSYILQLYYQRVDKQRCPLHLDLQTISYYNHTATENYLGNNYILSLDKSEFTNVWSLTLTKACMVKHTPTAWPNYFITYRATLCI